MCKKMDCFFTDDKNWFRYRAAAVIIEDGSVLMAKTDGVDYYYSIGGGVHIGESAEDAVKREVFEETGVSYEVDRLIFVHENFFTDRQTVGDKLCHEIALYFLMKPRGTKELPVHESISSVGRERVYWIPVEDYSNFKAFPEFFAKELQILPDGVKHIVTREY